MMRLPWCVLVAPIVALAGGVVEGQKTPRETAAALRAARGLQVRLWAAEPEISKPTNIAVDERGRVWAVEGVNYRRTQRNLPDLRPAGDRIVILEDTDLDGRADKIKVFDQNPQIRVPMGIAVLGDKVYISQSPDLIVYTKDADDNIVKREVLLTGFGGIDHDHGLHAVVFGPDGKYYFNIGNQGFDVTDRSGTRLQTQGTGDKTRPDPGYYEGALLRMNGDGTGLEVIGQNFRNPYEVAVDSFGNVFQTDNDDDGLEWTRLLMNMEGGNYGFRGPLNKTWFEDRSSIWHMEVPGVAPPVLRLGAGAPCGLLVYEGALLPPAYRGQILHADAGKRIVEMYPLASDGAGYTARREDVVNGGDDTWSRPTDVAAAPDGAIFIADWYDPGVGGHQMADQSRRGRIYRLAPARNRPQAATFDLASASGLAAALGSPNQSARYLAHNALAAQGAGAAPLLQSLWHGSDPILMARALWILGSLGETGASAVDEALRDRDPRFRILGLRVARLHGANMLAVVKPLVTDPSPQVRREVALMLRDRNPALMLPPYLYKPQVEPPAEWLDAMLQLATQYDGADRWYVEALGIAARGREDALYAALKQHGIAQSNAAAVDGLVWALRPKDALPDLAAAISSASAPMAHRIAALDALGWMQWPDAARAVESLIVASSMPQPLVERAFGLYSHQLFGLWTEARASPALPAVMRKAFALPATQGAAVGAADMLDDARFLPDLLHVAKSEGAALDARADALESLSARRDRGYLRDFQALAERAPATVRVAALRAIGNLGPPDVEWTQKIVLSDAANEVRTEAMRLLGRSVAGLNAILDLAEKGSLPSELQTLARNLTNNATPPAAPGRRGAPQSPVAMRARAAPPTDPAYVAIRARAARLLPMPPVRTIPTALQLSFTYSGKAANGRKIFQTDGGCAACHSLGGRKTVGPDLSAIGAKYGKQALLDQIVNPNDAIAPEYVATTFIMKRGDPVSGIVQEETADRIVVQTSADQTQRLKPADVESRRQSRVSIMPEGLLTPLSLQQITDLLEFLSTLKK